VTLLNDPSEIRRLVRHDVPWGAYGLADLDPEHFEHTRWVTPAAGSGVVVLVYRRFATPVVLVLGTLAPIGAALDEVDEHLPAGGEVYLVARPEHLHALATRYEIAKLRPMTRMLSVLGAAKPEPGPNTAPLDPSDLAAVEQLFEGGRADGESPDFFLPSMLADGLYHGIREGRELVAVAGTHVVSRDEGVAAIGNVFTRKDRRGIGFGASTTRSVVRSIMDEEIPTIVLNVSSRNDGAIRIYERIGFVRYCDYFEAIATRRSSGRPA